MMYQKLKNTNEPWNPFFWSWTPPWRKHQRFGLQSWIWLRWTKGWMEPFDSQRLTLPTGQRSKSSKKYAAVDVCVCRRHNTRHNPTNQTAGHPMKTICPTARFHLQKRFQRFLHAGIKTTVCSSKITDRDSMTSNFLQHLLVARRTASFWRKADASLPAKSLLAASFSHLLSQVVKASVFEKILLLCCWKKTSSFLKEDPSPNQKLVMLVIWVSPELTQNNLIVCSPELQKFSYSY